MYKSQAIFLVWSVIFLPHGLDAWEPDSVLNYFPLHVGDEWHYRYVAWGEPSDTAVISVYDTLVANGLTYYAYGSNPSWPEYYRADTLGNVLRFFPEDSTETIWYNFHVAEGDTYHLPLDTTEHLWSWIVYVESRHDTIETETGTFTDCIRLAFDVPYVIDEEHWHVFAPNVGQVEYYSAWFPPIRVYHATVGGVTYPLGSTDAREQRKSPVTFRLIQNYPNPFNPITTIRYTLPASHLVTLTVYDLPGREVATLVNGNQPAGEYQLPFDAGDLSSGIYIARLSIIPPSAGVTPEYSKSIKMLLLK